MQENKKLCKICNNDLINKEYENKKGLIVSYLSCEKCKNDSDDEKYTKYSQSPLNFGKYKKNKIIDIIKNDPEYVRYLITNNNEKNKSNGNFLRLIFVWNRYNKNI